MRFNVLAKPFDNPRVRQAVVIALSQKPFLEANVGDPRFYQECKSLFPCGLPLAITKGWEDELNGDAAAARKDPAGGGLRRHAHRAAAPDRRDRPFQPRDRGQAAARGGRLQGRPAADGLADAGRAPHQEGSAGKGGWHAVFTSSAALSIPDPVANFYLAAGCEKAVFGWPCDAEIERLRDAFARETDPDEAPRDRRRRPRRGSASIRPTSSSASSPCRRRCARA